MVVPAVAQRASANGVLGIHHGDRVVLTFSRERHCNLKRCKELTTVAAGTGDEMINGILIGLRLLGCKSTLSESL